MVISINFIVLGSILQIAQSSFSGGIYKISKYNGKNTCIIDADGNIQEHKFVKQIKFLDQDDVISHHRETGFEYQRGKVIRGGSDDNSNFESIKWTHFRDYSNQTGDWNLYSSPFFWVRTTKQGKNYKSDSELAQDVRNACGGMCAYCQQNPGSSIDHIVPLSQHGDNDRQNLLPCCHSCNQGKSDLDWDHWFRIQQFYNPEIEAGILRQLQEGVIFEGRCPSRMYVPSMYISVMVWYPFFGMYAPCIMQPHPFTESDNP